MSKYYLTKKGYDKIISELNQINEEMIENQKKIGESVALDNDLRENPDYMQLQNKASYQLPFQYNELKKILQNHVLIELSQKKHKKVTIGSDVSIMDQDGNIQRYIILGYGESDLANHKISYVAPIAKAMLGLYVDDEFSIETNLSIRKYKITSIDTYVDTE